jgi:hypothetical protein
MGDPKMCGEVATISQSPTAIFFRGPAFWSLSICSAVKISNYIDILELGYGPDKYGVHPDGWGMPIPDDSEYTSISTADFISPYLKELFSGNKRPVFIYMKFVTHIVQLISEIDAITSTSDPLDVILLGYGRSDVGKILCKYKNNVRYVRKNGASSSTPCSGSDRQINIYHFNDTPLNQKDFLLAMYKSFDIVGVTGDQSYLESLALEKIPVNDFVSHKQEFYSTMANFMKMKLQADTLLLSLINNVVNGASLEFTRTEIQSSQIPAMKSDMASIVQILRRDFDPKVRLKKAIDETVKNSIAANS